MLTGKRSMKEALKHFSEAERFYYSNFSASDKSAYSSYVGAVYRYSVAKPLMSPSEWAFQKEEREALTDFANIAEKLGLNSAQHAYTYYKSGLRHILKIIKKNPKKYSALVI